jgi:tagatose-6-phosphate ketose/aldose isomerase
MSEKDTSVTAKEIYQQPELWEETYSIYKNNRPKVRNYLSEISEKHNRVQVIFTGAGTSAYVGNTVTPYLTEQLDEKKWEVSSIPTTSIVSNPTEYLQKEMPTLLVSFARSGNSPESVATVNLAQEIVDDFYQLTITCSADGKLAQAAEGDDKNYLILMPERSNDQGFAMTGSYTTMTLTTLLVFSGLDEKTEAEYVNQIIESGNNLLNRSDEIETILEDGFERIIYLGSGSLESLAQEARLKVLELTAGQTAANFESSLGFRHGPKSFVNQSTLIFSFVSNDVYTRKYDVDMLNELKADDIAQTVLALQVDSDGKFEGDSFELEATAKGLPDAFLALPYILFGQLISIYASIELGHNPDNPSPAGTVNRVVEGVIIHEFEK